MGGAIARAVCAVIDPQDVLLSNRTRAKAETLASELGCRCGSNEEVASSCDYIFLAVKPQMMDTLLKSIAPILSERKDRFVLVSIAAGLKIEKILSTLGAEYPIIRIMPNTPAAIGMGMIQYCTKGISDAEEQEFLQFMSGAGILDSLSEELIDAASSVSGCGPAWAFQFIEALADGGVACGLPRAKAQLYAAQMLAGSAQLLLKSGKHPGQLKDAVCSPGGTTIQGVRKLEEEGFRGAVMDAVIAAYEKTLELG